LDQGTRDYPAHQTDEGIDPQSPALRPGATDLKTTEGSLNVLFPWQTAVRMALKNGRMITVQATAVIMNRSETVLTTITEPPRDDREVIEEPPQDS
jgi:hypothetical protein